MSDTSASYTRRGAIQAGAAGAAAGSLVGSGTAGAAKNKRRRRRADVIVVGAGYAGLSAAYRLAKAGKSVLVLEARKRVGGRSFDHHLPGGEWSELGATFVGPTQDRVISLAKELDVELFKSYNTGQNVYRQDGQNLNYSDTGPLGTAPPDPLVLPEVAASVAQLNDMSTSVPVDKPWTAQSAEEWDSQTLYSWVKDNTAASPRFMDLLSIATEPIFGAEARDLSLLYTLFYIAASGNEKNVGTFERNFNTRNGAQESRMRGGTQQVCIKMANRIGRNRVVLGSPVRKIIQKKGGGVRVESDKVIADGKRVIVAVPPPLASRIQYQPGLPPRRDQLTQRMPMGTLIKAEVFYPTPFWRSAGLTGQGLTDEGPVSVTFDISPPDGKPGILMCFIGGERALAFQAQRSASARRAAVLNSLGQLFGNQARNPSDYLEFSWVTQKWTRGCPVSVLGPGTLIGFGEALRTPVGLIHWAGTETSTYWNGYMDGAVRSGQRAANEVLARI